ncbi:MAG: hypothetical protein KDK91_31625, partial [Gammaproteobacteria bacterium]|nr:hypothetical protein [Gammaproteobacteria bacterium]
MRIKLGTRLFLGLASTSGLVLICALAGYQGIHNLSAALGYLSGPVWDTGRGATSVRAGVQAELLAVSELLGSDRRDGERVALEQAEQSTDQAAARMFASALIEAESREAFMRDLRTFREARTEVLDAHDRYRRANARVLEEFYRFQELMLDVQRLGDGYMEELAAFPGEDLSWTTTLRPRWAAAKAALESRISLLARFFHFQRALSQGLDADALAELDYYLGVMEETFAEITGHPTLGPLPLTQGEFAGQSVAAVLDERARAHVEGFEQTLEAFRGLRASTQRYRAASQSLLVMAEDIVQAGDARI